jgi:hypothetical protein
MSVEIITEKLLLSLKDEINKTKNQTLINDDIIKPMIEKLLYHLYPYLLYIGCVFVLVILLILIILILNIRINYYN